MTEKTVTITLPPAGEAREIGDYEGVSVVPAGSCAECGESIGDGDPIRKVESRWMHDICAVTRIGTTDVNGAWLLLADQIVQRPSAFRASDIRAVMQNVAWIARAAGVRLSAGEDTSRG